MSDDTTGPGMSATGRLGAGRPQAITQLNFQQAPAQDQLPVAFFKRL
jgi:hypothetical protein